MPINFLVDCKWSSFGNWSSCSKPCGIGNKTRHRYKVHEAYHGGEECEGEYEEVVECDLNECPGME